MGPSDAEQRRIRSWRSESGKAELEAAMVADERL
jgi:hypothetical protein